MEQEPGRLKNRLLINGLVFQGSSAPANSFDTREALRDLSTLCESEGADISFVPSSPLTFTKLITALESHGVVNPNVAPRPANTSSQFEASVEESRLSSSFNAEAQRHLQTEERNDANGSNDLLRSLISNSGIIGDEFSSSPNENFDTQSTVGTEPKPSFSGNHDVIPPPLQLTVESIAATETHELSSDTVKIKKLETEAAQKRQRML